MRVFILLINNNLCIYIFRNKCKYEKKNVNPGGKMLMRNAEQHKNRFIKKRSQKQKKCK